MIAVFFLLLIFKPSIQDSTSDTLRELIVSGWKEHQISKKNINTLSVNSMLDGIKLTHPNVTHLGSLVIEGHNHKKSKFADIYYTNATLDNFEVGYDYTFAGNQKGNITVHATNKTFTLTFQSMIDPRTRVCKTIPVQLKLTKEGPIRISAAGYKHEEALIKAENHRMDIVILSRAFLTTALLQSLKESILKREPKLCKRVKGKVRKVK